MKKLILSVLVVFIAGNMFALELNTIDLGKKKNIEFESIPPIPVGIGIHFSIVRGLRTSGDCTGKGWCRIDVDITIELAAGPDVFFGTSNGGRLSIALTDENIAAIREFNGQDGIIFDEDVVLPQDMVQGLRLTSTTIKKGVYKIKYNSSTRQNEILF